MREVLFKMQSLIARLYLKFSKFGRFLNSQPYPCQVTREQINVKMRGALENPQTQFSASSRLFLDQK